MKIYMIFLKLKILIKLIEKKFVGVKFLMLVNVGVWYFELYMILVVMIIFLMIFLKILLNKCIKEYLLLLC